MTIRFWRTGATFTDGLSWDGAYETLKAAVDASFAGDKIYGRSIEDETVSANLILTGPAAEGTTGPLEIISVIGDTTGSDPGNLARGATIRTDSAFDITLNGYLETLGVLLISADRMYLGNTGIDHNVLVEDGLCQLNGSDSGDVFTIGRSEQRSMVFTLLDTDVKFSNVGACFVVISSYFTWKGGTLLTQSLTQLLKLTTRPSVVRLSNLDLSVSTGRIFSGSASNVNGQVFASDCIMHASADKCDTIDLPGTSMLAVRCQAGNESDPSWEMESHSEAGVVSAVNDSYRAGGASDGVRINEISWKLDTAVGSKRSYPGYPLESPPITAFIPGDGVTEYTVRGYFAFPDTQKDDDIWIDITRVNHISTNSLGVRDTTRVPPRTTAANHPTDTLSSWTGSTVGTKQYSEKAFTPDKPGVISVQFLMASDAGSDGQIFADPFLEVRDSNGQILVRRAWTDPRTGGMIMEFTSPRAAHQIGVM